MNGLAPSDNSHGPGDGHRRKATALAHPFRAHIRRGRLVWLLAASFLITRAARPADPATPLSPQDTRAAQKIYNTKCSKCHKFYNPDQYSAEDWKTWMEKMSKKSKLKPAQYDLLSRYLETLRKPATPEHSNSSSERERDHLNGGHPGSGG